MVFALYAGSIGLDKVNTICYYSNRYFWYVSAGDIMSRNKFPEETKRLIIEKATELFLENGYENTTLQDIIDNLGGLTKGAVYHHFSSKNDILLAVITNIYADNHLLADWDKILLERSLNGKEKIKKMFALSLSDADEMRFASMKVDYKKTPELLSDYLNRTVNELAPRYFEPAIIQGIQDGSIATKYPKELAQVMLLLANIWLNPIVFRCDKNEMKSKFLFLCDMADKMGLNGILDDIYPLFENYTN